MLKSLKWIILPCLLFIFACNNVDTTSQTEQIESSDTLTYTLETYRIESKVKSKDTTSRDTTYYQVTYPQFKDTVLNAHLQSLLAFNHNPDTQFTTIEETGKAFIEAYDNFQKEDYSSPWAWYSSILAKVVENNSSYVSIEINYEDFMGGAHGNYGTTFTNYNLKSKSEITLDDIFPQENRNAFTQIAKDIFMKQEGIEGMEKPFDNYFFENSEFALNDNFLLKDSSVLFLYNVYEIKPYSDGVTRLEIPYSEIISLMSEEGKDILKINNR